MRNRAVTSFTGPDGLPTTGPAVVVYNPASALALPTIRTTYFGSVPSTTTAVTTFVGSNGLPYSGSAVLVFDPATSGAVSTPASLPTITTPYAGTVTFTTTAVTTFIGSNGLPYSGSAVIVFDPATSAAASLPVILPTITTPYAGSVTSTTTAVTNFVGSNGAPYSG